MDLPETQVALRRLLPPCTSVTIPPHVPQDFRVRFAIIWLSLLASNALKRNPVKTFSNGHPCFQACNAVEAIINFGPRMSGRRLA